MNAWRTRRAETAWSYQHRLDWSQLVWRTHRVASRQKGAKVPTESPIAFGVFTKTLLANVAQAAKSRFPLLFCNSALLGQFRCLSRGFAGGDGHVTSDFRGSKVVLLTILGFQATKTTKFHFRPADFPLLS
ncbi:uncharacterized protein CIMG_11825 [Coccidioides immitis RS]|uniref:Uncharacterized protein n=1 Tax=Coccidioides immitis (strain RS) TaxID=246410 RepID=A0A0D8JWG8_COCIM|nr:uncharacterized protein CIMG_11825 [Coccidioides immitis RS]KJF60618.1 hypothetical protein CIMG_11825 [Coccidioides immitis RS]